MAIFTRRNEVVAKVMFLLESVILSTGGPASVHAGIPPPAKETLLPRRPPCQGDPPAKDAPHQGDPPGADSGIRSMSGQYASYWNAFLLYWSIGRLNCKIRICQCGTKFNAGPGEENCV